MPSPFPGMDPYIEDEELWSDFHHGFIWCLAVALGNVLPKGLVANCEQRVYVLPRRSIIAPDVLLRPKNSESSSYTPKLRTGNTTVLERGQPQVVIEAYPEEIKESYITIRTKTDRLQIITIIEFLSPTNKSLYGEGQKKYLNKQDEILMSDTHLLEVDFLRGGAHTVSAPKEKLALYGTWDYLISLHKVTNRNHFSCWLNKIQESLPCIRVPLLEDMEDVLIDLQEVFNSTYDSGQFIEKIDYSKEPSTLFTDEEERWMDNLLREKGYR